MKLSPAAKKALGTLVAVALLGAAALVPAPYQEAAAMLAATLLGALHIQRPGDKKPE
jgi:hypothetical protein